MSLSKKVFELAYLSVTDTLAQRVLVFISTLLAYRLLNVDAIAFIGISAGYMVIVGLFSITPESVFVRDFPKIREKLNDYLSAFIWFWFYRGIILTGIALLLAGGLYWHYARIDLVAFFLMNHFAFQLGLLQGVFRESFFAEFRQRAITLLNAGLGVLQIILVGALFFAPSIYTYGMALLASAGASTLAWIWIATTRQGFRFQWKNPWWAISKRALKEFSLWTHLTSSANRVTYQFDLVILSFFASLATIASYTLAITIANMFLLFPQVLQRSAILAIANTQNEETGRETTGVFLKYFFLLAVGELVAFILVGRFLLGFFKPADLETTFSYTLVILVGMIFLNTVRPLGAVIQAKDSLKDAFFRISLPSTMLAITGYFIGAVMAGGYGVAASNIPVYAASAFLTIYFTRDYLAKIKFSLISPIEARFFLGKK